MLNCNLVLTLLPQLLIYVKKVWVDQGRVEAQVDLELLCIHEKNWLFAWRVWWRLAVNRIDLGDHILKY